MKCIDTWFWSIYFSYTANATVLSPIPLDPCDGRGIQLAAMVAFDAGTLTVGSSLEVDTRLFQTDVGRFSVKFSVQESRDGSKVFDFAEVPRKKCFTSPDSEHGIS